MIRAPHRKVVKESVSRATTPTEHRTPSLSQMRIQMRCTCISNHVQYVCMHDLSCRLGAALSVARSSLPVSMPCSGARGGRSEGRRWRPLCRRGGRGNQRRARSSPTRRPKFDAHLASPGCAL
uniref:Uncharacterized protein n=1 Tax=Aegilops tauschii subsp. strangulata TaxID=200361 RepID=A0A453BDM9_AEGTS